MVFQDEGADRDSKLVHTVVVTAANVADVTKTTELLHRQGHQLHTLFGLANVMIGERQATS